MASYKTSEADHRLFLQSQEDEVVEDIRVASLPSQIGWFGGKSIFYQNFWHVCGLLKGAILCQKRLKALDTDVFLITPPKSGTTWMKALIFSILNRKDYPNTLTNHPLLTNNPHSLVLTMEVDLYGGRSDLDPSTFASPRIFHSHVPFCSLPNSAKDSKSKIVYLCRNPKDTFTSLWHFSNKLLPKEMAKPSLDQAFDSFCQGITPYGPLWENMLCHWKESMERPEKVLFVKYEEMKEKPLLHLKKLAEFLDYPFSLEEEKEGVMDDILQLCSFQSLRKMEVNQTGILSNGLVCNLFFRKGEVGDSNNCLTAAMAEKMDQLFKDKLAGYGLNF